MRATIVPSVSHVKRAFRAHGSQLQVLRPHGAGQAVLGARTVVPDRVTPERARWRDTMRAQAQLWASLTDEEKLSWHDYAGRYGPQLESLRTRPSCEPFHGYRVFSAATSNLLAQGLPPCRTAPRLAPFDEAPTIGLTSMQPVLRLRVEHRLGALSGYALQLRIAPPTVTRTAMPRRKHVRPICGSVINSTFPLLPSGATLDIAAPACSLNPTGRTGIEARLLRLSDGMAGPWAWFILDPAAGGSGSNEASGLREGACQQNVTTVDSSPANTAPRRADTSGHSTWPMYRLKSSSAIQPRAMSFVTGSHGLVRLRRPSVSVRGLPLPAT